MLNKILLVALLITYSNFSFANERADIATLKSFIANFSNFSADFKQTQPEKHIFTDSLSIGTVAMQRPGKLFWQYITPDEQQIISDGKNLWIYDVDIEQATVRPLVSVQDDFPMRWLLFNESITDHFNIIVEQKIDGVSWFNLNPKENTFFQSIDIAIKDDQLLHLWMYKGQNFITKVKFYNATTTPIPASKFQFTPAKNVDLIGIPIY